MKNIGDLKFEFYGQELVARNVRYWPGWDGHGKEPDEPPYVEFDAIYKVEENGDMKKVDLDSFLFDDIESVVLREVEDYREFCKEYYDEMHHEAMREATMM